MIVRNLMWLMVAGALVAAVVLSRGSDGAATQRLGGAEHRVVQPG